MQIAICDDNKLFRQHVREAIFQYKAKRRLHIDVYEFSSGEELLESTKFFDAIFLDYLLEDLDGMQVARKLRERDITSSIIFVTNYPQFVFESFEVHPYRFLRKPITEREVVEILNGIIARQKLLAPLIVINESEQLVIQAKDIIYLEGAGKYCIVRTTQGVYNSSKTLAQTHAILPQHCFYRCHKSYVVNLFHVVSIENRISKLSNGEQAMIGRSKVSEFRRIYMQFVKDYFMKT